MARIAGVLVPTSKHACIALTYIYGIGRTTATKICAQAEIAPTTRIEQVDEAGLDRLRKAIGGYLVEGDLRRQKQLEYKRLVDLGCYRGLRHRRGLPARGQRTRTNAKTRKGRGRSAR